MMSVPWTTLTIDGVRPLNKAALNITCDLSLVEEGGEIVPLANGKMRSLRRRQFNQYQIDLSGESTRKPAIDHLRKGQVVEMGVPAYIDLPGDVADADLTRPAVPGSIFRFGEVNGEPVMLNHGDPGVRTTAFRPLLTVMILTVQSTQRNGDARATWSISAREAEPVE